MSYMCSFNVHFKANTRKFEVKFKSSPKETRALKKVVKQKNKVSGLYSLYFQ
jgi:hypothetical protein